MDKDTKDKVAEKALDVADLVLALAALFAGQEGIAALYDALKDMADSGARRLNMWRHHDLPVYVRPWIGRAAWICGTAGLLGTGYAAWLDVSSPAWMVMLGTTAAVALWLAWRYGTLAGINKLDDDEYQRTLTEFEADDAVDHPEPPAPVRSAGMSDADWAREERAHRKRVSDWETGRRNRFQADLRERFGARDRLGFVTFVSVFAGYLAMAVAFSVATSWVFAAHFPWVATAPFWMLMLAMSMAAVILVAVIAFIAGVAGKLIGGTLAGAFGLIWDSVFTTFLLNVVGKEASDREPKFKLLQLAGAFYDAVMATPVAGLVGFVAVSVIWPDPLDRGMIFLVFLALSLSTLFGAKTGNDVSERVKYAGRFVMGLVTLGLIYRIVEFLIFRTSGTRLWDVMMDGLGANGDGILGVLRTWWNGLIGIGWGYALLLIVFLAYVFRALLTMGGAKEGEKPHKTLVVLRYTLLAIVGVLLAVILIGGIADYADIDARIERPATADEAALRADSTGGGLAAMQAQADAANGRTAPAVPAVAPTAPVVPAVPVVAAPTAVVPNPEPVARRTPTRSEGSESFDRCNGLDERALATWRRLGRCP